MKNKVPVPLTVNDDSPSPSPSPSLSPSSSPFSSPGVLLLTNVTAGYGRHPAIHHVDLSVRAGSLTALVGPNGAGKSTLLNVITGRLKPMTGSVRMAPGARVAYLPQQSQLDRGFPITVQSLAEQGLWSERGLLGRTRDTHRERVREAVHAVGLDGFEDRLLSSLSGGQFQRALFARAMVQPADLVLLDEPFAAVDTRTTHELIKVLLQWQRQGRTVIAVMHDLPLVHQHFPDCILLARQLVMHGATAATLTDAHWKRALGMEEAFDDRAPTCRIGTESLYPKQQPEAAA